MRLLTPVLWIAFGVPQVLAFSAGMNLWFEAHIAVALLVFVGLMTIPVPYVGSLITTAIAVAGATNGWGWPWWQAYAVLLPFVALSVLISGVSGTFDVFTERPTIRPAGKPKKAPPETPSFNPRKLARRLDRDWKPVPERAANGHAVFADAFADISAMAYADRVLRPMAEANLPGPQFRLAGLLAAASSGEHLGEAVWWYRRAGELGYREAQYKLGALLEQRAKTPQDNAAAVAWTRSAADLGHGEAQFSLGRKYANGLGVGLDKAEAVAWYTRAAEQGHLEAQVQLGLAHIKGDGVRQDTVTGLAWLESAARSGEEDAVKKRDTAREGLEQDRLLDAEDMATRLPPPVVPAADADAPVDARAAEVLAAAEKAYDEGSYATTRSLLEPLAKARLPGAVYALARMEASGEGAAASPMRAVILYCRAGAAGHIRAQYEAGMAYLNGDGIVADRATALRWLRAAAEQGHDGAQRVLGDELRCGGGEDALREAAMWFGFAAQQGNAEAQYRLARALAEGEGVTRNEAKSIRWYQRAARQGHAGAQAALGFMHVSGRGVPLDHAEGVKWFRRAADQGHAGARYSLSLLGALDRRGLNAEPAAEETAEAA